ncbi:MAG: site-specific DNA-methyltransferase [Halobacteriaceae archaeon]
MTWETDHRVVVGDARDLDLPDDSVSLVVTSPPYPMIQMWDETFAALDDRIGDALDDGDGERAFRLMHGVLDDAWAEVARVLEPGGVACVNVGDATRTLGEFRRYPNHAMVVDALEAHGLTALPGVLWRKPTNSATKFMGSGMLPPNAYVTLEHEFVLVFRNGGPRSLDGERRRESAYFWEERNEWFSDVWELPGRRQELAGAARDRAAAYPFELPYRLVNMYSVQGDTVLDPFLGTGTTTLAALAGGRSSVGYERDPDLAASLDGLVETAPEVARERNEERLRGHRELVAERRSDLAYDSRVYDFPVMTRQERDLRLPTVESVARTDRGYRGTHDTFRPD